MPSELKRLLTLAWTYLTSNVTRVILAAGILIVVLVLGKSLLLALLAGGVGAVLFGRGDVPDSPRRTASGNIPNNPSPPGGSDSDTNAPGTPGGGPRRRRR